ncbi:MAG TPA: twin-arginine translocase TatA/TatE family subunit [Mycobacteriales bacterium]|nr:twin-arginine translocase TatA/TatE family subunit [Mycobacteriales bacterium]
MPDVGAGEILLMVLVAFALFGYRRLPELARSLGRSLRAFKAETAGLPEGDVRGKAEPPTARGPLGNPAQQGTTQPPAAPGQDPEGAA